MPQQAALSKCPSCEEPLESGDRFCGACGYDLSAVPARPSDDPTIALNGAVPPQSPSPAPRRARSPAPATRPARTSWPRAALRRTPAARRVRTPGVTGPGHCGNQRPRRCGR
ncbi:zinc ribbon domain-containing protein [Streptomyces sp. MNU103]|uniref:zinc ribbon domain-containing protein n=1 Tax=Streptomyces sp. MNU103 TaxID=2560024 RepID=UPI001E500CB0|nr:zinc ribbon domain-containing protein [Streptomyces sp. MNU103]